MDTSFMTSGMVWQEPLDGRIYRTIQADQFEVLFEGMDRDKWTTDRIGGFYFGRHGTEYMKAMSPILLGVEKYESKVNAVIRPELPISLRIAEVNWIDINTKEKVESMLNERFNETFDCFKIFILPKGPKGGLRKKDATVIENKNGCKLTLGQIISEVAQIQNSANPNGNSLHWPHIKTKGKEGIGIYRIGIKSKLPAFTTSTFIKEKNSPYTYAGNSYDWKSGYQKRLHDRGALPWALYTTPSAHVYRFYISPNILEYGKPTCSVLRLGLEKVLKKTEMSSPAVSIDMTGMGQGIYTIRVDLLGGTLFRCPLVHRDDFEYPVIDHSLDKT